MALFRCASGSSGGGATITVTYSSDFYGETVTCSHGTKTYSKVATSSGTLEFSVDEEGTWTISSMGFSDTADVVLNYPAELVSIPDGETVLPTDDIETWLACAGITDKAYTTLSQVLGDSETYNALLGDSNACAYMKRSTTFALQENLVPTMTGLTTPSGKCFGTMPSGNNLESFGAPNAFGKPSTYGYQTSSTPAILGYEFTSAEIVKKVYVKNLTNNSGQQPTQLVVKATNDEITINEYGTLTSSPTWTTLKTVSVSTLENVILIPENNAAYTAYAVEFTYSGQIQVGMLQFYSDVDITTSQYAMNLLGQYDTACDALLSDSTWASAIANSTYFESVLNVKVPVMTSNTTPSGTAFANSIYNSTYDAYTAFDNNASTFWCSSQAGTVSDIYVGYIFPSGTKVCKASVAFSNSVQSASYKIQTSNNTTTGADGTWTDASSSETSTTSADIILTDTSANIGFRLFISAQSIASGYPAGRVATLQFYGRKSSSEMVHGANGESAYILESGSPVTIADPSTLNAGTYTFYSTVAKDPADLTADYSKTIRICPNTKEIVVRPDGALYWWGYNNGEIEIASTANGWTFGGTAVPATFQTNYINVKANAGSTQSGAGTRNTITGKTTASLIYTGGTGGYGRYLMGASKECGVYPSGVVYNDLATVGTTLTKVDLNIENKTGYVYVNCHNNTEVNIWALLAE